MIHHLILTGEKAEMHLKDGMVVCHQNKIALQVLGSVQCLACQSTWSQALLCALAQQCPVVFASWNRKSGKWQTSSVIPRCRYVNPEATYKLCTMNERRSTPYASRLLFAKVENQHSLIRSLEPTLPSLPRLASNSFSRILQLEATWARFFWAKYFKAASHDLFTRERRQAKAPLNVALNYGYSFLYHVVEWQCIESGLEPGIGIIHRLRRSRPSLVCDLVEPLRCCVELTVMRYLDEMDDKKRMAGHFAEMLETNWSYAGKRFRLRSIIRLMIESFARAIIFNNPAFFRPFSLYARDACL